jgi:hypothetical protein
VRHRTASERGELGPYSAAIVSRVHFDGSTAPASPQCIRSIRLHQAAIPFADGGVGALLGRGMKIMIIIISIRRTAISTLLNNKSTLLNNKPPPAE